MIKECNKSAGVQDERKILDKLLVCVTEDWFALSHFKPLIRVLVGLASEVAIVTRDTGRLSELEALGVRAIPFDYDRASLNPIREIIRIFRMLRIIERERPDGMHLISMKPSVLGGCALFFRPSTMCVVHITGLGYVARSDTRNARLTKVLASWILSKTLRRQRSWLLVENPEDLDFVTHGDAGLNRRSTILGGAGVDPGRFPPYPETGNVVPVAAYVGRMIYSKGVSVLIEAASILRARRVPVRIELWGDTDAGNPDAIPREQLMRWAETSGVTWKGKTSDVAAIWKSADMFLLPSIEREGMPRAMLEAAACSKPLIVTDVPGCKHFVQNDVQGLLVPPGDPAKLADAIERLARAPHLRRRMGTAARGKFLGYYTEDRVMASVEDTYGRIII